MNLEAVLLTGGASRRMGIDKSSLLIEGEPLGQRIGKQLSTRCERVTILGRSPIEGFEFLQDEQEYAGPLAALSRFSPEAALVFISSCDLVHFDPALVEELVARIGDHQAALPVLNGRDQPLCALYRASAFEKLSELTNSGEARMMRWIASIRALSIEAEELPHGFACTNVNTPAQLQAEKPFAN